MKLRASLPLLAIAAAIVSLSSACDDSPAGSPGLDYPVEEQGPFAVGYREITVSYASPADGSTRTIPAVIWYPVDPEVVAAMPNLAHPTYLFVESQLAYQDAPPAKPAYRRGYPVLVHSHGHYGYANQSYYLGEGLATHGWVVIAPSHEGDALPDHDTPEYVASHYERPFDVSASLDTLENLPAGDPLRGRCDTSRVVVSGHSRGTYTVWAILGATSSQAYVQERCDAGYYDAGGGCTDAEIAVYGRSFRDPRVVAGMPMAGSGDKDFFGGTAGMNAVSAPVFMMSGGADPVGDDVIWAEVTNPPMLWIEIAGGCHALFGIGVCDGVDDAVAQPALRTYELAFSRHHVLGDEDPTVLAILDGTHPVSAIVDFKAR